MFLAGVPAEKPIETFLDEIATVARHEVVRAGKPWEAQASGVPRPCVQLLAGFPPKPLELPKDPVTECQAWSIMHCHVLEGPVGDGFVDQSSAQHSLSACGLWLLCVFHFLNNILMLRLGLRSGESLIVREAVASGTICAEYQGGALPACRRVVAEPSLPAR